MRTSLNGSCSCGGYCFTFRSNGATTSVECPCDFCLKTGAWFLADRLGAVQFEGLGVASAPHIYDGTIGPARNLVCGTCGDYVGAVFDEGCGQRVALNARLLDAPPTRAPLGILPIHRASLADIDLLPTLDGAPI